MRFLIDNLRTDLFLHIQGGSQFFLRMSEDRDLRKPVEEITRSMSHVKTPFLHETRPYVDDIPVLKSSPKGDPHL